MKNVLIVLLFFIGCSSSVEYSNTPSVDTTYATVNTRGYPVNDFLERAYKYDNYSDSLANIKILSAELINAEYSAWNGNHTFYEVKYITTTHKRVNNK